MRANAMKAKYWTVGELAERWATQSGPMPTTTIYNWIHQGKLKRTKLGGKVVVTAEDLFAFEHPGEVLETAKRRAAVHSADAKALADKYGY
jgi:uncharacterized protein YcaQ